MKLESLLEPYKNNSEATNGSNEIILDVL